MQLSMLFIMFMYETWDMYLNMDEIEYRQQYRINLSSVIFYMSFLLNFCLRFVMFYPRFY
jgi:hypothetical protein